MMSDDALWAVAHALAVALRRTRDALPDSANTGHESYDWCWDELSEDAQAFVKGRRAEANIALNTAHALGVSDE